MILRFPITAIMTSPTSRNIRTSNGGEGLASTDAVSGALDSSVTSGCVPDSLDEAVRLSTAMYLPKPDRDAAMIAAHTDVVRMCERDGVEWRHPDWVRAIAHLPVPPTALP